MSADTQLLRGETENASDIAEKNIEALLRGFVESLLQEENNQGILFKRLQKEAFENSINRKDVQ